MKSKTELVIRIFLGLILVIFGLNGFLNFMPTPPATAEAGALLGALAKTGYFFPFIKVVEIIVGVMLLSNNYAAFALVLFSPVLVGIAQINFILNPSGIPVTVVLFALHLFLVFQYREQYKTLLKRKV